MRLPSDEESQRFLNRNIDSLRNVFKTSYYDEMICFNKYLIALIEYMVVGHVISALTNPNYYNILSEMHSATVSLKNGKIEIYNFRPIFSINEDDKLTASFHMFNADIYYHDKLILDTIITITYYDDENISKLIFDSKILYDELTIDDYNDEIEINNKLSELVSIGLNKNNLLKTMIDYLEEILDPKEAAILINRPVFLFNEGDNEEDEEE